MCDIDSEAYDNFHQKCYPPEIHQILIQKLKFPGADSNWTQNWNWFCTVRYGRIWISHVCDVDSCLCVPLAHFYARLWLIYMRDIHEIWRNLDISMWWISGCSIFGRKFHVSGFLLGSFLIVKDLWKETYKETYISTYLLQKRPTKEIYIEPKS